MALEKGDAHYHLCLFPLEIESKQTQVGQKEDLETRFSESEETSDLSDHVPSNENLVHCAAHVQRMWSDLLDRMCVRLGERDWVDRKTLDAYFASCSPGFQLVSLRSERPKWDAEEKRFRVRLEFFRITLRKRLEMDMDMDMDVGESFEVKEIGADGAGAGDTNSVIQNPSLCYVLPSFNSVFLFSISHSSSFLSHLGVINVIGRMITIIRTVRMSSIPSNCSFRISVVENSEHKMRFLLYILAPNLIAKTKQQIEKTKRINK